jgi:hypothetical protein
MQFHQSHVQFDEKRLLLEKLKLMAIFSTAASSCKFVRPPPLFQRVSVSYSGMCLPASVMSHIRAICFKPTPKKKNRQNKTYKLKVVLKGTSKVKTNIAGRHT